MKVCNPFSKDDFRVMFRALYTLLASIWVGAYLWKVSFTAADKMSTHTEFIVGFVLGTLIATLINFYFGGSENATKQRRASDTNGVDDTRPSISRLSPSGEDVPGDDT